MNKIKDRKAYYPDSIERLTKLEKDKSYERVNSLSCTTPHLTREIKAYNKYELDEVWSSTIYFRKIAYSNAEDYVKKSIDYCHPKSQVIYMGETLKTTLLYTNYFFEFF